MNHDDTETALVDALRAGDREAFQRLYADYHAQIYNLCARILGDREEARDVTQDVFISAYCDLPPSGAKLRLRPWLFGVATHACLNSLRRRRRGGGEASQLPEELAAKVDTFAQAETVSLVEASLAGMNDRYRTALVLKDLHGLPPDEIAEVMEVSRPTADVLVHRARGAFKTAFRKLAGDVPAPASLAAVLLPLSVPAALHVAPPLPSGPAPVHPAAHLPSAHAPAVPHAAPVPDLSSAAGPGGAGLLAKIGAALTTKVAIGAAAATLLVGGTVAVRDVEHSRAQHRLQGQPGATWQSAPQRWSKHWARWSLFSRWMRSGWPMGWTSGHWRWNSGNCSWTWSMKDSTWSWSDGGSSTGSWGDGSWSMTMNRSGSKGWSSSWGGSGSSRSDSWSGGSKSGSWSGSSRSGSSGSWSGSSGSGSSGDSWDSGSSGGSWDSGSSGGSWNSGSGGSGW